MIRLFLSVLFMTVLMLAHLEFCTDAHPISWLVREIARLL